MAELDEKAVRAALAGVIEPDIKKDIESLKMVKSVVIDGGKLTIAVELPSPAYLEKEQLSKEIERVVRALPGVASVGVELTAKVERRSTRPTEGRLPGVKNIIAVAAGK